MVNRKESFSPLEDVGKFFARCVGESALGAAGHQDLQMRSAHLHYLFVLSSQLS